MFLGLCWAPHTQALATPGILTVTCARHSYTITSTAVTVATTAMGPYCCICRSIGYYDQAFKLMSDLKQLIDAHESAVGADYEARLSAQQEARHQLDQLLQRQQADEGAPEVQQNESTKRD